MLDEDVLVQEEACNSWGLSSTSLSEVSTELYCSADVCRASTSYGIWISTLECPIFLNSQKAGSQHVFQVCVELGCELEEVSGLSNTGNLELENVIGNVILGCCASSGEECGKINWVIFERQDSFVGGAIKSSGDIGDLGLSEGNIP